MICVKQLFVTKYLRKTFLKYFSNEWTLLHYFFLHKDGENVKSEFKT
jgi:hypothetical protein